MTGNSFNESSAQGNNIHFVVEQCPLGPLYVASSWAKVWIFSTPIFASFSRERKPLLHNLSVPLPACQTSRFPHFLFVSLPVCFASRFPNLSIPAISGSPPPGPPNPRFPHLSISRFLNSQFPWSLVRYVKDSPYRFRNVYLLFVVVAWNLGLYVHCCFKFFPYVIYLYLLYHMMGR